MPRSLRKFSRLKVERQKWRWAENACDIVLLVVAFALETTSPQALFSPLCLSLSHSGSLSLRPSVTGPLEATPAILSQARVCFDAPCVQTLSVCVCRCTQSTQMARAAGRETERARASAIEHTVPNVTGARWEVDVSCSRYRQWAERQCTRWGGFPLPEVSAVHCAVSCVLVQGDELVSDNTSERKYFHVLSCAPVRLA